MPHLHGENRPPASATTMSVRSVAFRDQRTRRDLAPAAKVFVAAKLRKEGQLVNVIAGPFASVVARIRTRAPFRHTRPRGAAVGFDFLNADDRVAGICVAMLGRLCSVSAGAMDVTRGCPASRSRPSSLRTVSCARAPGARNERARPVASPTPSKVRDAPPMSCTALSS
jgi:hypothetical protein